MTRKMVVAAASLVAVLVSAGLVVAAGSGGNARAVEKPQAVKFATSELFIEINGTDGDAGLQLALDGEKWDHLRIVNPRNRTILDVSGNSALRGYGVTGLTFESAEPPFDEFPFSKFKARFPAGTYRFVGTTVDGQRIVGSDRLTHTIPAQPVVVAPAEDAVVAPEAVVVEWQPVTEPQGIRVVHYEVIVTQEEPHRVLDLTMPPDATRVTIPDEFLEPGKDYALEVLVREASGNQIITEVPFRTA